MWLGVPCTAQGGRHRGEGELPEGATRSNSHTDKVKVPSSAGTHRDGVTHGGPLSGVGGGAGAHLFRALSRFSRIWGSSPLRTDVFTNSSPVGVLMNWSSVRLGRGMAGGDARPPPRAPPRLSPPHYFCPPAHPA